MTVHELYIVMAIMSLAFITAFACATSRFIHYMNNRYGSIYVFMSFMMVIIVVTDFFDFFSDKLDFNPDSVKVTIAITLSTGLLSVIHEWRRTKDITAIATRNYYAKVFTCLLYFGAFSCSWGYYVTRDGIGGSVVFFYIFFIFSLALIFILLYWIIAILRTIPLNIIGLVKEYGYIHYFYGLLPVRGQCIICFKHHIYMCGKMIDKRDFINCHDFDNSMDFVKYNNVKDSIGSFDNIQCTTLTTQDCKISLDFNDSKYIMQRSDTIVEYFIELSDFNRKINAPMEEKKGNNDAKSVVTFEQIEHYNVSI